MFFLWLALFVATLSEPTPQSGRHAVEAKAVWHWKDGQ